MTFDYWYPKDNMVRGEGLSALYEWNSPIFTNGFILYNGFGAHAGSRTIEKTKSDGVTERVGRLGIGADGVVGIEYKLYNAPVAFSLDYRPFFNLLPFTTFFGNVGLGVKVCF